MKHKLLQSFIKDTHGAVAAEFVVVSFGMLLIVFFVVELTLLYAFVQAEQKAAQAGVRLAAVSDPAVPGLPEINFLAAGEIYGTPCSASPSPCTGFATTTCDGGDLSSCTASFTDRILPRMQNLMPGLLAEHVSISYAYEGLGYAGGPVIPAVTVTITDVPHQTGILGVLFGGTTVISAVPDARATLTGEDLNSNGA